VAASGLKTRAEVERYQAAGIRAFLIGEALVTQADPGAKLREFMGNAGSGKAAGTARPKK